MNRPTLLGAGLGAALMLAVLAPGASAGTAQLEVTEYCDFSCQTASKFGMGTPVLVSVLKFVGRPAESNDLNVGLLGSAVSIRDAQHPTRAVGPACGVTGAGLVRCNRPTEAVLLRLRDGDDRLNITEDRTPRSPVPPLLFVDGGAGDDRLSLARMSALDPSGRVMAGGSGSDTLVGSPLGDVFVDQGTGERDVYLGGAGRDLLSYAGRNDAVRVNLGGRPREDRLSSIENLVGGRAGDVLTGSAKSNRLDGGPGNDRVAGGAGNDALTGGRGADRLIGGPGADVLDPGADDRRDRVSCGPGADVVDGPLLEIDAPDLDPPTEREKLVAGSSYFHESGVDAADSVAGDCERVNLSYFGVLGQPRRVKRAIRIRVRLRKGVTQGDYSPSRVRLYRGKTLLGTSRPFRVKRGRTKAVSVKLNRRGLRAARRGRAVTLTEVETLLGERLQSYTTRVR